MATTTSTKEAPAAALTTETSLSLLYRVLRIVIRPLRPRLVKPGDPLPAGSPRLANHPRSKNGCNIAERKDEATGLWLYDLVPQSRQSANNASTSISTAKHIVLYFAGGGFQSPPASEHWAFVSKLASDSNLSSQYTFTIVSYPLAPNSPACESIPLLRKYLTSVCQEADQNQTKVTLMGDSAGGNVALSLGLWMVQETSSRNSLPNPSDLILKDDDDTTIIGDPSNSGATPSLNPDDNSNQPPPPSSSTTRPKSSGLTNILVISPAVDMRNTNPDIQQADNHDPVLSTSLIEQTASAWISSAPRTKSHTLNNGSTNTPDPPLPYPSSGYHRADPTVSPLLYPDSVFQALRPSHVKIHGAIGTHDVLAPDAELFRQKCTRNNVDGSWLVWKGQMHCFILAGVYGMKEGKKGTDWIVNVLSSNA